MQRASQIARPFVILGKALALRAGRRSIFGFIGGACGDRKAAQKEIGHMITHANHALAVVTAATIVATVIAPRFIADIGAGLRAMLMALLSATVRRTSLRRTSVRAAITAPLSRTTLGALLATWLRTPIIVTTRTLGTP